MTEDVIEAPTESEPSIDMSAAVDKISADLFPSHETETPAPHETMTEAVTEQATTPTKTVAPLPTVRQAPKSWAKDVHPVWEKIDPKAQDYIEKREKEMADGASQYRDFAEYGKSLQAVVAPYQPLLQAKGLDAPRAIDDMLGAYARLTQGTMEQRQTALMQIAKNLQIAMPSGAESATPVDPRIQTIEQQLQAIQDAQTQQQRMALDAARQKASAEVTAFATETNKDGTPTHAFFDECHEDIVKFLTSGDSLQEAYDKAVWANPVTREKQKLSYFQTESEKAKERARLDALPKQKARGVNVNGKDTLRHPTDPLGSMEDTMRSTLKSIKERTTH